MALPLDNLYLGIQEKEPAVIGTCAHCQEEVREGESVWDDVSGLYVEQMLDRLPRPLRECVYWRYVAGENSTQIAQRLSIPAATVRTRLRSAVMILRSIQKEEE